MNNIQEGIGRCRGTPRTGESTSERGKRPSTSRAGFDVVPGTVHVDA